MTDMLVAQSPFTRPGPGPGFSAGGAPTACSSRTSPDKSLGRTGPGTGQGAAAGAGATAGTSAAVNGAATAFDSPVSKLPLPLNASLEVLNDSASNKADAYQVDGSSSLTLSSHITSRDIATQSTLAACHHETALTALYSKQPPPDVRHPQTQPVKQPSRLAQPAGAGKGVDTKAEIPAIDKSHLRHQSRHSTESSSAPESSPTSTTAHTAARSSVSTSQQWSDSTLPSSACASPLAQDQAVPRADTVLAGDDRQPADPETDNCRDDSQTPTVHPAPQPRSPGKPPPFLNSQRLQAVETAIRGTRLPSEAPADASLQGRRELLLPKRLSQSNSSDDNRRQSLSLPPASPRPTNKRNDIPLTSFTPGKVPPIRAFRSSGSRRSLPKDMNFTPQAYDLRDNYEDGSNDITLRGLENRFHADANAQLSDADRHDDSDDVFLRIAREDTARRLRDNDGPDDVQSSVSRIRRTSHRRPLSTATPSYNPVSPPRLRRRLSDQQDAPRPRYLEEDQGSELSRSSTYRSLAREKAMSAHPGEDVTRPRTGTANTRPSPLSSSRSVMGDDAGNDGVGYARRRASVTDGHSAVAGRNRSFGYGAAHSRHYGTSPLAKALAMDHHNKTGAEISRGTEGAESVVSTTAPSTVWDELDELKSRIMRLEVTGKMPSTSAAAISRMSDERPATATTTVTTMSLSPKRQGLGPAVDATSTTSSQKEAHPILQAALVKTKPYLSVGVYQALESAAHDAMALSSMMGSVGQRGPMSSMASATGTGTPVSDRQFRRKADSVCRSLTELCVALGETTYQQGGEQGSAPTPTDQLDGPATPTIPKSFSGLQPPRRLSINTEQGLPRSNSSPRTLSKFEERRSFLLNGSSLPTPKTFGSTPATPVDGTSSRRSSLMIGRTRRAGTEEPELGRSPSILRSRRATTEEPEPGHQTPLLRSRRGTAGEGGEEQRFRPPSRAETDVNTMSRNGDYQGDVTPSGSGIPRRRFPPTSLHTSRFSLPAAHAASVNRRYTEQAPADYGGGEDLSSEHPDPNGKWPSLRPSHQRAFSLTSRRNRDNMASTTPTGADGRSR